jgi:hypothetical protein
MLYFLLYNPEWLELEAERNKVFEEALKNLQTGVISS